MKGKKLTQKEYLVKLESAQSERRKLFQAFCKHLAEGFSVESFPLICGNYLKNLLKSYPEDFPQEDIDLALHQGMDTWEVIGKRQSTGQCLGNSRTWYYNMAHRYKWSDRLAIQAEHSGNIAVNIVSYASTKPSTSGCEAD